MLYLIYKITNKVNNKIYIGKHKTDDIEDGYMGSGYLLKKAIDKYGEELFIKDILYVFDNEEKMNNMEKEIVNEEFLQRSDVYNLREGGEGGFDYINKTGKNINWGNRKGGMKHKDLIESNMSYRDMYSSKASANLKKAHAEGKCKYNNFIGKKHSEETKKKIGESNSLSHLGIGNPNFNKVWMFNSLLNKNIMVKKDEINKFLSEGWKLGRKLKS